MDSRIQEKYADALAAFILSDEWKIIKFRIKGIYKKQVQSGINLNVKNNNNHSAAIQYGKLEGADETINITERIAGEVKRGQFDVDEALHVIENR